MLKFLDILESYWDPYEDEDENEYGFRDRNLDDIKIHFNHIATYDAYSLVKDTRTNIYYISYTDDIDIAYQQGYFTRETEEDEDGRYGYWEFNDDSAETTPDSFALFTQEEVKKEKVTNDVIKFANGNADEFVLIITKENKKLVYENFWDLIKESFYEKKYS
jgi:hypothetical protein